MGRLKYKGYTGSVDYDEEKNYLTGKVLGLKRDNILYEGESVPELVRDFQEGIDDYLATCQAEGIEPEKPFSGKIILRMTPSLHGEAAERAASAGISLNEFINRAVRMAVQ